MRRLLLAAVVAFLGCGNCRTTLHLEFDFDNGAEAATSITISVGYRPYTYPKAMGSTKETLDVKVPSLFVNTPIAVAVSAYASSDNQVLLGSASTTTVTSDSSCMVHVLAVHGNGTVVPGSDMGTDMSPSTCATGCGSGVCAGSCINGTCRYSTDFCATCSHGIQQSGSCSGATCSLTGAPSQCPAGICADGDCGTPINAGTAVATGKGFTCAIVSGGASGNGVHCWGQNAAGVLGAPATVSRSYVPLLVAGTNGIIALAAGDDFVCGLRNGDVVCWGGNQYGQLGIGTSDLTAHPTPTPVMGLPMGASIIAAGGQHACAAVNSAIYCWGHNMDGELSTQPNIANKPGLVMIGGVSINSIALGQRHMCFNAQNANGNYQVVCFGASALGQVGVADGSDHPNGVVSPAISSQVKLSAGGDTTCAGAIAGNGATTSELRCWGSNSHGQLGGGPSVGTFSAMPVSVCGGNCNYMTDFAVGFDHTCAAFRDGVKCWGNGSNEQLGFVSSDSNAPMTAAVAKPYGYVAAGFDQSCAIYRDDLTGPPQLSCWGSNQQSQLGLPDGTMMSGPAAPHWSD